MDYWTECIEEALDCAGLVATKDQIAIVADFVSGAHDNYGMAFGHDRIPNPMVEENRKLQESLDKERHKRVCKECKGSGEIIIYGPTHCSVSQCDKCRGEGKV